MTWTDIFTLDGQIDNQTDREVHSDMDRYSQQVHDQLDAKVDMHTGRQADRYTVTWTGI